MLLMVSPLVAIAVVEIVYRAFGSAWFRRGRGAVESQLRSFLAADTDEERQRLILRAGVTTLRVSLAVLALTGLLLAIVGAGPWAWRAHGSQLTTYSATVSICALAWSIARSRFSTGRLSPSARQQLQ